MAIFSITSETHGTKSTSRELFGFLADFKNFEDILPSERVSNFTYTADECSFQINGITQLTVKLVEKSPYSQIVYESQGLAKFNFRLRVVFAGQDSDQTCMVELTGDMNPFIRSMAERPLKDLVNTMSLKLAQLNVTAS